eukprot:4390365-Amphidinium_carterae.2
MDNRLTPHIYIELKCKMFYTTTGTDQETKPIDIQYFYVQQLQSDGELRIHRVSTENNPSDLMTKYLETAKIKKHSEAIGLHRNVGSRGSVLDST